MKRYILFLAVGLVFGTGDAWCQSVSNHNFESGSLNYWTVSSESTIDGWSIASGVSYPGGLWSAWCRKPSLGGSNHFIYQEPTGLSPDVTYRANAWIDQGLTGGNARFGWFLIDGTPLSTVPVTNGEFWQFSAEGSFSSGQLATGVVVCYEWMNANGEAFFDTVTIGIVPPTPTPTVTSTPTATWTPWEPVTAVDLGWEIYR